MRGKIPRIKIIIIIIKFNKIIIINSFPLPKYIIIKKIDIKIIIPYSPKKIKAKEPLKYSTLNPETNSDSPSIKSIGLRFNSAKILIKNTIIKGINNHINHK